MNRNRLSGVFGLSSALALAVFQASCVGAGDSQDEPELAPIDLGSVPPAAASPAAAPPADSPSPDRRTVDGVDHPHAPGSVTALSVTPAFTTKWAAPETYNGSRPPDPQIAVSTTDVIVTGQTVGHYTKGGQNLSVQSFTSIFNNAGVTVPSGYKFYDSRAIFDEYRDRFWLVAAYGLPVTIDGVIRNATNPVYLIAVSKTSDPRDGYWAYQYSAISFSGTVSPSFLDKSDYPSLGVDSDAFYIAAPVDSYTASNYTRVLMLNADQMAAGVPQGGGPGTVVWREGINLTDEGGAQITGVLHPAVHHGSAGGGYFVVKKGTTAVSVLKVTDPLGSPTWTAHDVTIPGAALTVGEGQQGGAAPDLKYSNLGNVVQSVVYRGGKLHFTHGDMIDCGALGSHPANRYVSLDVSTATPVLHRNRRFGCAASSDPAGTVFDYGYPAVEINAADNLGIVSVRTGTTENPSIRASSWFAGDADISSSVSLVVGAVPYYGGSTETSVARYGDLGGASVDPYDDTAIWFAHEYPVTPSGGGSPSPGSVNWRLYVGKLYGTKHADLLPTAISTSTPTVQHGTAMNVGFSIQNQGDGGVPVNTGVKAYLSTNTYISTGDTLLTCTINMAPFSVNQIQTGNVSCTVPATLAAGSYYLGIIADSANVIQEYSETSNMPLWLTRPAVTVTN